ncbi:hypothetical protein NLJ89_g662 [Agrocybe chaxingu]|uniref:Uncharacterized protein n=1 Tax=Agrocybe chaxingu TaxID=84603 RepID=A0A9W8N1L8_9AGAR|nr:hypothetical protein NLJ89_g662 [Agrocybe chaxingu]
MQHQGLDIVLLRLVHFDSPVEDPLTSHILLPGFNVDDVAVDFQWRPFDRNDIVVPSITQGVAFARNPSKGQGNTNNTLLTLHDRHSSPPRVTRRSTDTPPKSPFPHPSPRRRDSPCPFRFLPPSENAPAASIVPAAQEPPRALTTPKMPPFAPVPGVYISPLQRQQMTEPPSRARLTVNGTSNSPSRDPVYLSGAVEVMAPIPPVRWGVNHEGVQQRRTMSQSSNDSIESWDDKEEAI